jgi:hypothetical protein
VKEPTWWEVELQFQAAMCDPEDVPGQTVLVLKNCRVM